MVRRTIAGFMAGFAVALIGVALALPHCPQEDSCKPDYYRQDWHIIETEH